jgi:hypothetical protein
MLIVYDLCQNHKESIQKKTLKMMANIAWDFVSILINKFRNYNLLFIQILLLQNYDQVYSFGMNKKYVRTK